ncbi:MAG: amino acid adenylation domain-containing protein, partial [Bacteroidota bacterium]
NLSQAELSDVDVKGFDTGYRVSTSDLRIEFTELRHGLELSIDYNTDLFTADRIHRMLGHFLELFISLASDPGRSLDDLNYLSKEEQKLLLHVSTATDVPVDENQTLISLFERQAALHPTRPAVTYKDKTLSYQTLNEKANQLAHHLMNFYGVMPGDVVAMMLDRSENLIVGILGILKAGAAYLPLDPGEPETRKSSILQDAGPRVLITESSHIFNIGEYACELFAMDSQMGMLTTSTMKPVVAIVPQDLAYVIYTSGSTGVPKGVMVEHGGVVNVALDHSRRLDIRPTDVTALFFPVSFDASVFKIFMTLLSGGGLVILDESMIFDPHECLGYLRATQTTIASFTPSYINLFNPETLNFLRAIISGGEAPNYKQTLACSEYTRMFNAYGPSECSVCATIKEVGKDDRVRQVIPIGAPIDNVHVFLSDDAYNLIPIGTPGELWISGKGVARGYLNNPELTHERFQICPFEPGARAYRTGDLGKWTADGQIEFLGRKDRQVKIRGFRIELGEIENVIRAIPEINDAAIKVIDDENGDKHLAAYYISKAEIGESDIKTIAAQQLPGYMLPNFYVKLDEFPRTANGKINYDALPAIDEIRSDDKDYVEPETELQRKIASVWEEQLNVEKIGIAKNFFSAGGDSIKAIRVAGSINKLLGTNIEVKEIFEFQDVASLARHIESLGQAGHKEAGLSLAKKEIDDVKKAILDNENLKKLLPQTWEDIYPMSEIQKGMVFYTLMNPTSGVYHDQMYYQFHDESFDLEMFARSIDLLVERQSIFRTSFHLHDFSEGIQIVHRFDSFKPDFEFISLVKKSEHDKKRYLEDYLHEDRQQSFDFSRAGIWRIRIFQLDEHEYGFLLIGHHAIIDGWSDASFRTELSNVYFKLKENSQYKPDFLKATYKDYIIDQHYHKNSDEIKTFWKNYLDGYVRTELPLHRSNKVSHQARQQASFLFSLSPDLTTAMFQFSERNDVSIKDLCLAGLTYLLKFTTNTADITLGLLTNGRPAMEDADKIYGCFLNTVPFRQTVNDKATNREFLKTVCENSRQTKSYDKLPLTSIMEVIGEKSGTSNPIFDVLFNFVNMHIINKVHDSAKLRKPIVKGFGETNTLLDLIINCSEGYIQAYLCSYQDIYERDELERLAQYFQRILKELISDDVRPINQETVLGNKELNLVTSEFSNAKAKYPTDPIQTLFELQVNATPLATALVEGKTRMSYAALNTQANKLAHYLRENYNIQPDDRVGMMMNRSAQMIVGILGILKSGAAYVPIDPTYPKKRIALILDQADVKVLLTESELMLGLGEYYQGELFAMDLQLDELNTSDANPSVINNNSHLAYIMFTSGSTGLPKGVAVEHRSVVRLVRNTNYAHLKLDDQVLQLSNYAFDGSVFDIYGALLNGSTLHIISKDMVLSHHALANYIAQHKITTTFITTALFNNLVELNPESIGFFDKIYFGGEEASLTHIRKALQYRKREDSIVHVYGPTESTTFSTYHVVMKVSDEQWTVPIGKPITNTSVHILNDSLQPVPLGAMGEICLGGDGLAREYWKNDKLTAEKFIQHPFVPGALLYKTGDLGKWDADGAVHFCGRKDAQVKIRGNRVELPEIENLILQQEGIKQVHV